MARRTAKKTPVPGVRKIGRDELLYNVLLEEQLRRKGTTIARVKRWKPEPPWYIRLYWTTLAEEEDFKRWAIAMIKRNHRYRTMRKVRMDYAWWSFITGLHAAYSCPGTCGVKHPVDPAVAAKEEEHQRWLKAAVAQMGQPK